MLPFSFWHKNHLHSKFSPFCLSRTFTSNIIHLVSILLLKHPSSNFTLAIFTSQWTNGTPFCRRQPKWAWYMRLSSYRSPSTEFKYNHSALAAKSMLLLRDFLTVIILILIGDHRFRCSLWITCSAPRNSGTLHNFSYITPRHSHLSALPSNWTQHWSSHALLKQSHKMHVLFKNAFWLCANCAAS